jgi:hypothetical protein
VVEADAERVGMQEAGVDDVEADAADPPVAEEHGEATDSTLSLHSSAASVVALRLV